MVWSQRRSETKGLLFFSTAETSKGLDHPEASAAMCLSKLAYWSIASWA